jgi:hypothetical protein
VFVLVCQQVGQLACVCFVWEAAACKLQVAVVLHLLLRLQPAALPKQQLFAQARMQQLSMLPLCCASSQPECAVTLQSIIDLFL